METYYVAQSMDDKFPWEKEYKAPEPVQQQSLTPVQLPQVQVHKTRKHVWGHVMTGEGHNIQVFDKCATCDATFACEGGKYCLVSGRERGLFGLGMSD